MIDTWDTFLAACPSWKCASCGYWNGGLMNECAGKVACPGRRPAIEAEPYNPAKAYDEPKGADE